jgi:hypothetical protein
MANAPRRETCHVNFGMLIKALAPGKKARRAVQRRTSNMSARALAGS